MDSENQITFMQPQVKQRNSNLELYRIIVMLLIVAHHYVVNSGMMEEMAKDWYQLFCTDNGLFHVQIKDYHQEVPQVIP